MNILDQLRRDEGLRLKPYRDTVGKLTIGIGRNLDDVGISEAEANYLLGNDVANVTSQLRIQLPWVDGLIEPRFAVLQNLGFNIGIAGLLKFHNMLDAMQHENWELAAYEMRNSAWYGQVGDRAKRLETQLLTGAWQ